MSKLIDNESVSVALLVEGERIRPDRSVRAIWYGGDLSVMIDTTIVYALAGRLGLYGAGLVSYLVAASSCWALNRAWTFRGRSRGLARHQWARYLLMNLSGLVLNRGTYATLVTLVPLCAAQPVLAVAGGAVVSSARNSSKFTTVFSCSSSSLLAENCWSRPSISKRQLDPSFRASSANPTYRITSPKPHGIGGLQLGRRSEKM